MESVNQQPRKGDEQMWESRITEELEAKYRGKEHMRGDWEEMEDQRGDR